jgi:hypothetical protein
VKPKLHTLRRRAPRPAPGQAAEPGLGAAVLEAHPLPTLVVDGSCRVVAANGAARRLLHAREGVLLGDALGCVDARTTPAGCGSGPRCSSCTFQRTALRALAGETVRDRGYVMKDDEPENDLHLIARASPFDHGGSGLAILALDDANDLLGDPAIIRVCEGCGRVRDEEGGWHPLNRFLEDRLGIETAGPLCADCAGASRGRPAAGRAGAGPVRSARPPGRPRGDRHGR